MISDAALELELLEICAPYALLVIFWLQLFEEFVMLSGTKEEPTVMLTGSDPVFETLVPIAVAFVLMLVVRAPFNVASAF